MPHSYGLKARTRHKFAKGFRQHGAPNLTRYLTSYRIGDYVDIKVDSSVPKGQPYRYYHGRTGKVWNVTPRAVGVELLKRVGPKYLRKKIHIRIEHVKPSGCQTDILRRRELKKAARDAGLPPPKFYLGPALPKREHLVKVKKTTIETINPIKYEFLV